ncbi:MAG: hypothetical protein Q8N85_00785, partial [Candidatus Omnitrophota bacterium]|nr:hypothetical protein [Candidatus Omnitrophota bacterium]
MTEELRNKARELLKSRKVEVIIGYQRAADGVSAQPCFIDNEKDAGLLIWDSYCVYNLANYLKDYPGKSVGILAKSCDLKSIVVLLQENQLKRENLFILGIDCLGVVDEKRLGHGSERGEEVGFARKCKKCPPAALTICDFVVKDAQERRKISDDYDEYESVRKQEVKAASERSKFWEEEFSRCIRCYACRQVCPMCYCPKCVADQSMPAWFS